jgi:hypothetical protein
MNSAKVANFRPKTRGSVREHRISGVFATSLREKERERRWGNLLSLCYPQRRAADGRPKKMTHLDEKVKFFDEK